jgi:carboxyl-terminal processing protease
LQLTRRILAEISGEPGSSVKISYLDGGDRPRTVTIKRERLKGELSPPLGNFPPQYTEFEAKRLPGDIGYIRFNIFTTPVMAKVRAAMREFGDTRGLVFDLRGNPGGVGAMAAGIAGLLTTRQGSLGTMKMRKNQLNFVFFPQVNPYEGPVAVLIDGGSGSTSEIFAGGLQEIGRAVVVGERSVGAALPSYFLKLPTGAIFQYAIADFKTPKGVLIEGRGVIPDLEVKLERKSLLAGRDVQLEAGIERLQQKARAVK